MTSMRASKKVSRCFGGTGGSCSTITDGSTNYKSEAGKGALLVTRMMKFGPWIEMNIAYIIFLIIKETQRKHQENMQSPSRKAPKWRFEPRTSLMWGNSVEWEPGAGACSYVWMKDTFSGASIFMARLVFCTLFYSNKYVLYSVCIESAMAHGDAPPETHQLVQ